MLRNNNEVKLLSNAMEPGIRNPSRRADQFPSIINRFMSNVAWDCAKVIDLGPGHFDFGEEARKRGAVVTGLEMDPVVVELGQLRGFSVIQCDLTNFDFSASFSNKVDGIFCNGSINAYWFHGRDVEHVDYIRNLISALKPNGWAWIAPWNSPKSEIYDAAEVRKTFEVQRQTFESHGFVTLEINRFQRWRYAISTVIKPAVIYTRNLNYGHLPW